MKETDYDLRIETTLKSSPIDLELTERAAEHVKKFLEKRGRGLGLRVGLKTSGCSGISYKLKFVDNLEEFDLVFESRGVKVIVDKKSFPLLIGTVLDYGQDGLNSGFKFINPNEKGRCGCGESFSV